MVGFDLEAGRASCAQTEAGYQAGKIIITSNEAGRDFLNTIKDGTVKMINMEKYETMDFFGVSYLYTFHNDIIRNLNMDTGCRTRCRRSATPGLIFVTADNVDTILAPRRAPNSAGTATVRHLGPRAPHARRVEHARRRITPPDGGPHDDARTSRRTEEDIMERRFVGKVALVTGATNGIGRATAVRLAAEGALVGVNRRPTGDASETLRLAKEAGGEAFAVIADMRDPAAVTAMVHEVAERGGVSTTSYRTPRSTLS